MRAILGLALACFLSLSQLAKAECFYHRVTTVCADASGSVTTTTRTGNGWIRTDGSGQTTTVTNFNNGSITVDGAGNISATMQIKDGSLTVGSNRGTGQAWSETNLRVGGVEVRQSEYGGNVLTEMKQSVGGGYVVRSVTDPDGTTRTLTCGPNLRCQ
jgi:hypothetical protein